LRGGNRRRLRIAGILQGLLGRDIAALDFPGGILQRSRGGGVALLGRLFELLGRLLRLAPAASAG
jgi:hypothetical protein